jgi:hypothetical protein
MCSSFHGNQEYSRTTSRPPYTGLQLLQQFIAFSKRSLRKLCNIPSTNDVGTLAEMIQAAASLAFSNPDFPRAAMVTYPKLRGLYQDQIDDALEYLRIAAIKITPGAIQPTSLVTAYAGHGLGLCETPTDFSSCITQQQNLPDRKVVLLEYTESALLLHHRLKFWSILTSQEDLTATKFTEGSAFDLSESAIYDFIFYFLRQNVQCLEGLQYPFHCPEVVTVVLTGDPEAYEDGRVQRAVEDAVKEFGAPKGGSRAEILFENPQYVSARGAADMAWRSAAFEAWDRYELR